MHQITFLPTFPQWQSAARRALAEGHHPREIAWEEQGALQTGLPLFTAPPSAASAPQSETSAEPRFRVPRDFLSIAQRVACHRAPYRWALLYRILWRLTHGQPELLEITVDEDIHQLTTMDKAVRHDVHKMRAFVRFRLLSSDPLPASSEGGESPPPPEPWYIAWFEPQHHIVELNAPFFRDRFAQMKWSILTPGKCAHWDGLRLTFTPGVPQTEAPTSDEMEDLWRTYYGHIFNPARIKVQAMLSEMPQRYWKNLPEATIIPTLLNHAPSRVRKMRQDGAAKSP